MPSKQATRQLIENFYNFETYIKSTASINIKILRKLHSTIESLSRSNESKFKKIKRLQKKNVNLEKQLEKLNLDKIQDALSVRETTFKKKIDNPQSIL
jgi:hypothetical protein